MFEKLKLWFDTRVKPLFHGKWQVRGILSLIVMAVLIGFSQRSIGYPVWTAGLWFVTSGVLFYLASRPK